MIHIKFDDKEFKIYANKRVECLEPCIDVDVLKHLKRTIEMIMLAYNNPSDGFPVSFLVNRLQDYDIEVLSYRDYGMEKAQPGRVY